MPIFEYECAKCGDTFELLVRSSSPPVSCPLCRSDRVKKLFSMFAASAGSSGEHAGSARSCGSCSGGHCSSCH